MAHQAIAAESPAHRAQVAQLIQNLEPTFIETTRKSVVVVALHKAMSSQNVNFVSERAAAQIINHIENRVAGKITAFTADISDTVQGLTAGRCSITAALGTLGAVQTQLQEMTELIEVKRAAILNLLCGMAVNDLQAIRSSVSIRQLFDELFPSTLRVLIDRQSQA